MFTKPKSKEDCMQDLSSKLHDKLFSEMKKRELSDKEMAQIILRDCLELKLDEENCRDLSKVCVYTHTRFNIPANKKDFPAVIAEPIDYAVYLAVLGTLPADLKDVTKTVLYQKFIEQWFDQAYVKAILSSDMPEDGHDILPDFHAGAEYLARIQHHEKEIKNPVERTLAENPHASLPDVQRAIDACPLRKKANGSFEFIHPNFEYYFTTKFIVELAEENARQLERGLKI